MTMQEKAIEAITQEQQKLDKSSRLQLKPT